MSEESIVLLITNHNYDKYNIFITNNTSFRYKI